MVDLLGRAGRLREAEKLIQEMGTNPDCIIWRSLLSASLVHGDIELAETAGREIIKQDPDDDGVYVLLWNMYAGSNRWKEALEMRQKMRDRKVMKIPGCSWIELDGIVHEFLVEDRMHCLLRDIYQILKGMTKHLKTDATHATSLFEDNCV
nr:pentatricopeptide repeat protein AaPPR1570 [Agave angustifolia]UPT49832.1 pentatricopeptide repeat protein AaPPR148 [Agave angustifolia]